MAIVGSSSSRVEKIDADVSEKAPDSDPVIPFNFEMEIDKELAIRKCDIPGPDMEIIKWHIRLNHLSAKSR